jgi:DNA-binding transcriptional LysR family regulator
MEWGDIRVFLQVARAGQMARASKTLGLDHSTISRRIARLEEQTGVPLFDRAGRRLSLTEAGAKLLAAGEKSNRLLSATS